MVGRLIVAVSRDRPTFVEDFAGMDISYVLDGRQQFTNFLGRSPVST